MTTIYKILHPFRNSYKKKMIALLEGLQISDIDEFISIGKTGDYRHLGEMITKNVKTLINEKDK